MKTRAVVAPSKRKRLDLSTLLFVSAPFLLLLSPSSSIAPLLCAFTFVLTRPYCVPSQVGRFTIANLNNSIVARADEEHAPKSCVSPPPHPPSSLLAQSNLPSYRCCCRHPPAAAGTHALRTITLTKLSRQQFYLPTCSLTTSTFHHRRYVVGDCR